MPWYRHLLWPFALLYGLAVWIRNRLYDFGVLASRQFDVPIVCVGNLETGGTGKSPVVLYLLKLFSENGLKVAMLSRGYGRKTSGYYEVKVSSSAEEVGDEPLQAKLRNPSLQVVVCENRVEGIEKLMQTESHPDVIVMDDGFQHRRVNAGLNILVTPSALPFWKNQLLPVGTLREAKSEAKRAHILMLNGGEQDEGNFHGSTFGFTVKAVKALSLKKSQGQNSPKNVVLLSGIGNSKRFEDLTSANYKVLAHLAFPDHHRFTKNDIQKLQEKLDSFGASADAVLTTEKDAVRLRNSPVLNELKNHPIFYLTIDLELNKSHQSEFDKMILHYGKYAGKD